jgi:cysteine desulfurase
MEIYLDNSATTRVYPEVAGLMTEMMLNEYGNPSSLHNMGMRAENQIKEAKMRISHILKCQEKEIIFTSCGTESDNLALIGTAYANQRAGKHLITTQIEHPAVLETMHFLEEQGFEVTYLPVDSHGSIRLEELGAAIRPDTILVSVMHTNNEIGTLEPIAEAGELIKQKNPEILFHVDAVQGFGKALIYPGKMKIDLLSVSGHKIHAAKGTGFLYVREKVKIKPILFGGGQQHGMRSGTESVPLIAGLGLAAQKTCSELEKKMDSMYALRNFFIKELSEIQDVVINGQQGEKAAPHIVSVSIKGIRAEVLLHVLDDRGICVSSGSACASNHPQVSATLKAIGAPKELLDSTIRFSFSEFTTKEELEYTLTVLQEELPKLRKYARH